MDDSIIMIITIRWWMVHLPVLVDVVGRELSRAVPDLLHLELTLLITLQQVRFHRPYQQCRRTLRAKRIMVIPSMDAQKTCIKW